jgi:hypothetical protein
MGQVEKREWSQALEAMIGKRVEQFEIDVQSGNWI